MENVNFSTYRNKHERQYYKQLSGYMNAGEKVAFSLGLMRQPMARILDIGIGGGRTTAILRKYTNDYTGIDCVDSMVAMAQKSQPGVRLRTMDARDMSYFPDERFDLVFFSYNGLDAVHCAGRSQILSEVARLLGGIWSAPGWPGRALCPQSLADGCASGAGRGRSCTTVALLAL
jgi:ubiquinone/menaquinone biosynthesis C-methylase UbiE